MGQSGRSKHQLSKSEKRKRDARLCKRRQDRRVKGYIRGRPEDFKYPGSKE